MSQPTLPATPSPNPSAVSRADFRFAERLRVRWAEIDMQKIVFNGHYLMYVDTAVAGYWRTLALPYPETLESFGGDLYVRKVTLEYLGSARYDEMLEVGIRCTRIGNSSMVFTTAVMRGGEVLVSGELIYVFADPATQTSKPVPAALRAALEAYEAGEPMVEVQVGHWRDLGREASSMRRAVFTEEQGIPAELDDDGADATAVHVVARNRVGLVLGTGRMLETQPGVMKIGRMAVRATVRGGGVGSQLLAALVAAARERGCREIQLTAQASAIGFYSVAGFRAEGERFTEAGLPHQTMTLAL